MPNILCASRPAAGRCDFVTYSDWKSVDAATPEAMAALCAALDRSPLARQTALFNDPRWVMLLANRSDKHCRVYSLQDNGIVVGLAVFLAHPSSLPVSLGEITLASWRVLRLDALAPPIVDAGGDRAREYAMLAGLLRRLRADLTGGEIVWFESVAEGSPLVELIGGGARIVEGFHVLQNGKLYAHRFAVIPASFDLYLALLGRRTRADLRSNRKRFAATLQGRYRVQRFQSIGDVQRFVFDAMAVSAMTYQYRQLGGGLRDREALERSYNRAAELGWLRSYILYVDDKPVAFQVGCVYGTTFAAQEIGYDPAWSEYHVGIFLHTEIVSDLAATGGAVTLFDFGNGDTLHKQRLGTAARMEGYFYAIPQGFRNTSVTHAMRATHRLSTVLGNALERRGMRKTVRDALRRLGVKK